MKLSGVNEVWSACQPGSSGHSSFIGDLTILQDKTQSEKARKMANMFSHHLSTEMHIIAKTKDINTSRFTSWAGTVKHLNMKVSKGQTHPKKVKGPKSVSLSILLLVCVVLQNNFFSLVRNFAL